jgi:hypothetical protein
MNIRLADLRLISEKLFAYLEDLGVESIDLAVDYYWNIPMEQMYDSYEKPFELDMGQLTFDWDDLQKLFDPEREPLTNDFVDLAAILRAIGDTYSPFTTSPGDFQSGRTGR